MLAAPTAASLALRAGRRPRLRERSRSLGGGRAGRTRDSDSRPAVYAVPAVAPAALAPVLALLRRTRTRIAGSCGPGATRATGSWSSTASRRAAARSRPSTPSTRARSAAARHGLDPRRAPARVSPRTAPHASYFRAGTRDRLWPDPTTRPTAAAIVPYPLSTGQRDLAGLDVVPRPVGRRRAPTGGSRRSRTRHRARRSSRPALERRTPSPPPPGPAEADCDERQCVRRPGTRPHPAAAAAIPAGLLLLIRRRTRRPRA